MGGADAAVLETDLSRLRIARAGGDPSLPRLEYSWLGIYWPANGVWQSLQHALAIKLTPGEIQDLIAASVQCQGKHAFATTMLQLEKIGLNEVTHPIAPN